MDEQDLILGEQSEPEETPEVIDTYFQQQDDLRANVDTAIAAWNFLDEIDGDSPFIIENSLKRAHKKARKQCFLLLCNSLNELCEDKED
jgi:hypothetical protein